MTVSIPLLAELLLVAVPPRPSLLSTVGHLLLVLLCFAAGLWAVLWLIRFILLRVQYIEFGARADRVVEIAKVLSACGYHASADRAVPAVLSRSVIGEDRLPHHVSRRFAAAPVEGRSFELMNFAYTVHPRPTRSIAIGQTVALISNGQWNFPRFAINPHGQWRFVAIRLGTGDINFDSHPKFSRLFKVQSEDETALRALLKPAILEMIEQHKGLSVEGLGDSLVFYIREKELKPAQYPQFQEDARKIAALFLN